MAPERKTTSTARTLGHGLAHVQHMIDGLWIWGLKTARELGAKPEPKSMKSPALSRVRKFGKQALRFLGSTGEAYYEKYGELKKNDTR
ncbi:MAG: hypothetical protein Q7R81_03390 [Candidatus Peregrinibacteria bacterium]|nr:hypothetical protein [Candidatus Peregrinibacteria bacterium]